MTRKLRPRTLSIEKLEPRQVMAASITATLNGGVLRVIDSASDDKIVFHRKAGEISIGEASGSWSVASIDAVHVELGRGNDYVSIRRLEGIDVTITAGGNDERVKLADGRDVYFAGLGKQLEVVSGLVSLDEQDLDWSDTNLAATSVRHAVKPRAADGVMDRKDMIHVFRQVADDGKLTKTEWKSLHVLVKQDDLFTNLLYVQVLSKDVVMGNPANALYRGKALGDLRIGSSGEHLDKLVDKWFFGKDHPVATYTSNGKVYHPKYVEAQGRLFGSQIKYTDIVQGVLGDCYFLATLAETAKRQPKLVKAMFIDNGDKTFTVRFFNGSKQEFVTVDRHLPALNGKFVYANMNQKVHDKHNILWVALAEKAYVQTNESGWLRPDNRHSGQNSYQAVSGGWPKDALQQVTGIKAHNVGLSKKSGSFATFLKHWQSGYLIDFISNSQKTARDIVHGHVYAVIGVDAKKKTVTLYNPWGPTMHAHDKAGILTLKWHVAKQNFYRYSRTV